MMNLSSKQNEPGDWLYGGVDPSFEGNGGPECAAFLSPSRRLIETILALSFAFFTFFYGWANTSFPTGENKKSEYRSGRRALLALFSLVFGIELGFKFATRSLLFLLNPCHVTTLIQIYLLAAKPSPKVTKLFRVQIYFLNGAVLAMLFPVTNTRLLPFENEIYWIQHLGMLVVPYYLLRLGGVYTTEKLSDFSWSIISYGLNVAYHFTILQGIGLSTQVNLNSMLCPAISDPFYGPNYRVAALLHQAIAVPIVGKLFCIIARYFITSCTLTKVKDNIDDSIDVAKRCHHCDKKI